MRSNIAPGRKFGPSVPKCVGRATVVYGKIQVQAGPTLQELGDLLYCVAARCKPCERWLLICEKLVAPSRSGYNVSLHLHQHHHQSTTPTKRVVSSQDGRSSSPGSQEQGSSVLYEELVCIPSYSV